MSDFLARIDIAQRYKPRAGRLLVSEPFLQESWFKHSVTLLVDYETGKGAQGLVLNHESSLTLDNCVDTDRKFPVFVGGPVGTNRMTFLHTLGDLIPGGSQVLPGLWLGGDFSEAVSMVSNDEVNQSMIRFFLGYSGWEAGQLENEIKEHTWAVAAAPADAALLLGEKEDALYHEIVRELGPRYSGWRYHPHDPKMN